jgi:hypothetical protein
MPDVLRTVFAVLVTLLMVVALSSMAAGGGEPAGIKDTLTLIAAAGAVFGTVVSQALEDTEWFQKLTPFGREIVVKVVTFALPLGAFIGLEYLPAEIPPLIDQAWVWIVLGLVGFASTQIYHAATNRGRTRKPA